MSIIESFVQENSIKKIYSIEDILSEFENRSYSVRSQVKKNIVEAFQYLIKCKIIQSRFVFLLKEKENNQEILRKDTIELQDIHNSKSFYFYEILHPMK